MSEDFRTRAKLWPKGRLYEDFVVGEVRAHHWGRTITESDTILFSTLTLSYNPHYTNRAYAQAHGHPDLVVNPLLVFNTVLGLSVEDNSEIGGPFVGVDKLTYHQPVYPGDTLTARSTTVAMRVSASNPRNGIVTWHTEGLNQRDERVIDFERSNLVRLRNPAAETAAP
ncbi:MAG: MaoC family dehydratase [Phenylobacterium sp.]